MEEEEQTETQQVEEVKQEIKQEVPQEEKPQSVQEQPEVFDSKGFWQERKESYVLIKEWEEARV